MDALGWVLAVLLCLFLAAQIAEVARDMRGAKGNRLVVRHRVLVNLDTGKTFAGVLWCKTGDWLVLRNAEIVEHGREPLPVDGEVVIERGRVEFVQAL